MAAKGDVKPENLPSTESTAINHSQRAHQQTITWENLAATTPNPLQWGWREENGKLTAILMDELFRFSNVKTVTLAMDSIKLFDIAI